MAEEEIATYGSQNAASPTKQMFTDAVEERETRKTSLARLSLLNKCEDWQEGGY